MRLRRRFITTWCLASLGVLGWAGGAQAQTCTQWAETMARAVSELRELRAELRDLEIEFRESDTSSPGAKEKWITEEVRRLAAVVQEARAASEAADCGAASAISSAITGSVGLRNRLGVGIGSNTGTAGPVMTLTLAGDRVTLQAGSLAAVSTDPMPMTVVVAGVLRVPCLSIVTFTGSGSGAGAYDAATGHMFVPMTLTPTETILPASADPLESLVCPAVRRGHAPIAMTLSTRGAGGLLLDRRFGTLVLTGPFTLMGSPLTLEVGSKLSPVFP